MFSFARGIYVSAHPLVQLTALFLSIGLPESRPFFCEISSFICFNQEKGMIYFKYRIRDRIGPQGEYQ